MEIDLEALLVETISIARKNNDSELEKWARLELEGYFNTNSFLTESVIVPKYREIAVTHMDIYKQPFLVDADLSFINNVRTRFSVPGMEDLVKKHDVYYVLNDSSCEVINKNLNLNGKIVQYCFSTNSLLAVLVSIREELFKRTEKYISRKKLIERVSPEFGPKKQKRRMFWYIKNITIVASAVVALWKITELVIEAWPTIKAWIG